MNIAAWLEASACRAPDDPALLKGAAVDATYRQFTSRAAAIGAALRTRFGLDAGDRVALFMSNRTEYLEALYGIWWAGGIAVPVNAKLHGREASWIIADSGARLVFTDTHTGGLLDESKDEAAQAPHIDVEGEDYATLRARSGDDRPVWREDGDIAWTFYTSGTTGRPKGAMLTHGNLVAMSLSYLADVDRVESRDAALYAAPLSHGAGLYNFIHVRMGARHVVPESGGFEPREILDLGEALGNISMFAAPTMVRRLVEAAEASGRRGDGIKTVVYGGGPMYLADIERAIATLGQRFVQIYGQGETPMTITALSRQAHMDIGHPDYRRRLTSVGTAQSCVAVRVVDAAGNELPRGESGEIAVSGATVMKGYWNNPVATADSLRNGWLMTGDIGHMDECGFLTLTDRSKDVIISGGSNIYPREIEEVLLRHPDIAEVAVVGHPDPEWGEIAVAFVVCRSGAPVSSAELDAMCLAKLARFKRPKRYVALSALPKNNYGKVLKTELRNRRSTAPS